MNSSAKLIATSVLLLVGTLNANGAMLEQKGQADGSLARMTTYGMEVSTRSGLKTVLPPGWQLFIHPSVRIPDTMSWTVGDPWPAVLAKFAQNSDVSVLIDWDARQVLMRTEQIAQEERSTRSEIQAAATTPLPRFSESPRRQQAAVPAVAHSVDAVPVIRVNPTPVMVEEQQQAALRSPPQLKSTDEFAYSDAKAWNRASAKALAQSIASRYRLRLVWAAPDFQLQGPVTLLARSPEEDTALLQKAMGVYSSVTVEHSRQAMQIVAYPRGAGRDSLLDPRAPASASSSVTFDGVKEGVTNWFRNIIPRSKPEPRATEEPASHAAPSVSQVAADHVTTPSVTPKVVLSLAPKQPLEDALFKLSRELGYTLEWKVDGGFEANRPLSYSGVDLPALLSDVLPQLGLSADIYSREKHIVVRGATKGAAR